jgi:hypothetical protein
MTSLVGVSYDSASDDEATSAAPAVGASSITIVAAPDVYVEVWSPVFCLFSWQFSI